MTTRTASATRCVTPGCVMCGVIVSHFPKAESRQVSPPARPLVPRTAAGERAARRRRARVTAVRRPPSGVLPSTSRTAALVSADVGHEVDDRQFRMGRWARLACTVSLLATGVVLGLVLLSSSSPQMIGEVTVAAGDSLWSIARHAEPEADPRAVVEQIKKLNGLDGDTIAVGVVLKVPFETTE